MSHHLTLTDRHSSTSLCAPSGSQRFSLRTVRSLPNMLVIASATTPFAVFEHGCRYLPGAISVHCETWPLLIQASSRRLLSSTAQLLLKKDPLSLPLSPSHRSRCEPDLASDKTTLSLQDLHLSTTKNLNRQVVSTTLLEITASWRKGKPHRRKRRKRSSQSRTLQKQCPLVSPQNFSLPTD
jgi:hypothetical protein